jgi:hypothetical protein
MITDGKDQVVEVAGVVTAIVVLHELVTSAKAVE